MSDKAANLAYLLENSKLAKTLNSDEPVTLEILLGKQPDFNGAIALLQKLMELATNKLKLLNCLLRNQYPYDAIADCSEDDLVALKELADYLYLPKTLIECLELVQKCGKKCGNYRIPYGTKNESRKFNIAQTFDWAYFGDIEGIKWLLDQGYECDSHAICHAVRGKQIDCLEWLYEINCPGSHTREFEEAASNGDLEMLQLLYDRGKCVWNGKEYENPIKCGNLKCIQWLYEHGCPLNSGLSSLAFHNGQFECLKYIHEHGCPLPKKLTVRYYTKRNAQCMNYVERWGTMLDYDYDD